MFPYGISTAKIMSFIQYILYVKEVVTPPKILIRTIYPIYFM